MRRILKMALATGMFGGGAACPNPITEDLTVTAGNTETYTGDTCIAVGVTVTVEDTGTLEII